MIDVGSKAPSFKLESDAGEIATLASFAGSWLVVYFYPKDDTPGCTREAQAFTEAMGKLKKANAAVVGISKDSVTSHCNFRDKYALKFPLLSDPELVAHNAFGAYGEKTSYGKTTMGTIRSTFIIDPKGMIAKVFPNVKVDGHADAVLAALNDFQAAAK